MKRNEIWHGIAYYPIYKKERDKGQRASVCCPYLISSTPQNGMEEILTIKTYIQIGKQELPV